MLFHKLLFRYFTHKDDVEFYVMQAEDAIGWLERNGVELGPGTSVLDLGCGLGVFGRELQKKGCTVTFADVEQDLLPEIDPSSFLQVDVTSDDLGSLGTYDLVIFSNVLEHISRPDHFLLNADKLLNAGGKLYLSWVNWLSPWGGHQFSLFHYLGPRRGHLVYDKVIRGKRIHTPFINLFPTSIGETLKSIRRNRNLEIIRVVPRYYPELSFVTRVPLLREFLTGNCAILIQGVSK